MVQKGSRGQNWSLEILISLGVFILIFVLALVFMFLMPQDPASRLQRQSSRVLGSLEREVGLLDSGNINRNVLTSLEFMTCDEIKDLLVISADVCIHFESIEGVILHIGDNLGVGCPDITFDGDSGMVCGVSP